MPRRVHTWVCAGRTELGGDLRTLTSSWRNTRAQDLQGAESFTNIIPLYPSPTPGTYRGSLNIALFYPKPREVKQFA